MKPPRRLFPNRDRTPNYLPAVAAIAHTATRGMVNHVNIYHDEWCGIFKGKVCNCNPRVERGIPTPVRNQENGR